MFRTEKLHLPVGLTAAAFLIILGTTGALLAFEQEIDARLNPQLLLVEPRGEPQALAKLTEVARAVHPTYSASALILPERAERSLIVSLLDVKTQHYLAVFVDPFNGRILGDSDHENSLMATVRGIHKRLALPGIGSVLTFGSALGLMVLVFSGIQLWWRGRRFTWHSLVGICAALFVLPFAITALRPIPLRLVWRDPWTKPGFLISVPSGAPRLSPDQLLLAATQALPGARPVSIGLRGRGEVPADVYLRFPEDHSVDGRSIVYLNPYTGAVQAVMNPREMNLAARYAWAWNWDIHTGRLLGEPSRVLASIASASLAIVAISGVWLWWSRKTKRRNTFVLRR